MSRHEPGNGAPRARDWCDLPLGEGGRSLIEASAGTGKTWTISVLYLRLLLEQALSPRQIVVTTFTNAAAQELRERLRARLLWAQQQGALPDVLPAAVAPRDAAWLHARWRDDASSRARDMARVALAIAELDVAPIGTLHGLCGRIIAEHPFACGSTFRSSELIGSDALLDELAGDLLRQLQQTDDDSEWLRLQQHYQPPFNRRALAGQLRQCLMPDAVVPCLDATQIAQGLPKAWAPRLRALVACDALFTRNCALRTHWAALADVIDDPTAPLPSRHLDNALANATKLNGIAAKAKTDPEVLAAVAFSVSCFAILEPLRARPAQAFWQAAAQWARAAAATRMQARNQHTFDDLLLGVHDAMQRDRQSQSGPGLADALYRAWPVALVDEFQDTDSIQYGILDQIYRAPDGSARGRLVMIGDPKQAIYRFRGGDIHAYLRAAGSVSADSRISLAVNYRASANLVAACNAFYARAGSLLGAADDDAHNALDIHNVLDIRYRPVQASQRQDATPYCVDGQPLAQPLCVHYLADPPASSDQRQTLALQVCANQIAQMLQSRAHRIGDEPLQPSDIAVLLPSNRQVESLRELLIARAVPCIASTRSGVFAGDSARELLLILHGIAHCDEQAALRAAAATRLWGISLAQLRASGDDPAFWQPMAQQFHDWRQRWLSDGVHGVIASVIEAVASRVLASARGERMVTDLRHLAELLQAQSELRPGIEELLAWLREQHLGNGDAGEEAADTQQLRIESEQKRVRLMTLHACKGLEFPIVFLPLMWAHGEHRGSGLYLLSDPAGGPRRIDSSAQGKAQQSAELFNERFRLLYVALTRAMHACHLFALPPERMARGDGSKPAVGHARSALDVMLARMQPALHGSADPIEWRTGWQPQTLQVLRNLDKATGVHRVARALPSIAPSLAAQHSFTTLSHAGRRRGLDSETAAADEADVADGGVLSLRDQSLPSAAPPHPELSALAAIRGKAIGNAIHSILENRVIGESLLAQKPLLRHWLSLHAVDCGELALEQVVERLARRLQAALAAPLGAQHAPELCLDALAAPALRAEMAFFFPLAGASLRALERVCSAHGEAGLVPADSRTLLGLMTGKIDLIFEHRGRFHLLDYKGNLLGEQLADYQGAALQAAMDASQYRLQALLYAVALDRYLRQRLGRSYQRSQHLGECFYLFVRAAGLAADTGIWRHRFSDALLDAVNAVLSGRASTEVA